MSLAMLQDIQDTTPGGVIRHFAERPVQNDRLTRPPRTEPIAQSLELIREHLPLRKRILHAGETVYQAGDRFVQLHIIHSGCFKVVNLAADGRERVVALHFKGDWLGFDGIADGHHDCDVVAMDTGEVWSVSYQALLEASVRHPRLLTAMHSAMSREISRDRDSMMSLCTLPADARVAEFLHQWVTSLASCGLRTDQITLRMTRAEIGNYLGMTLESVSRALSRLAREKVICFAQKGRREVQIPEAAALARFVEGSLAPACRTVQ